MKTILSLILAASFALVGCGGGGDDGSEDAVPALVKATTTHSAPDSATTFANDWLVTFQSPPSQTGLTGDIRYRACVRGIWRQSLKADATLRLSLSVFGQHVRTFDNIVGKAGPDNRIEFIGCGETFTRATQPTFPRGSITIQVQAMTNRSAFPINGYDAEVEWEVVRVN